MNAEQALTRSWDRRRAAELEMLAAPAAAVSATPQSLDCRFYLPSALPRGIAAQWDVLADNASEANAFGERWFLEPSLALLAERDDVRLAVVMAGDGLLAGLIPLTVKPEYGRIPIRNVQNWRHDNMFLGEPMVRRGMETAFWAALLDALNDRDWATGLLHINGLVESGPVHRALRTVAPRCDTVFSIERALLRSDLDPETYWTQTVRKKKRKEMDRLAKRLDEEGQLGFATLEASGDIVEWIDAFLALEHRGWKGTAGSALACEAKIERFFREVCIGAHRAGKLDFHRLDLDGRPIAMLVNFLTAPGGFSFKIAFDEEYARFSPGVHIERYNLGILARRDIHWVDSCASEDHPMINSLWSDRRRIVRVTVPLTGRRNRLMFLACRWAEDSYAALKKLIRRDRGVSA